MKNLIARKMYRNNQIPNKNYNKKGADATENFNKKI